MKLSKSLIEKLSYAVVQAINEARIQRTIDKNIWATVSSVISKKYRADKGASAKPRGDLDTILKKYVCALVIFKEACPVTDAELKNSPVFNQWANALLAGGLHAQDVVNLYNQNTGTAVSAGASATTAASAPVSKPAAPAKPEPVVEVEPEPAVEQKPVAPAKKQPQMTIPPSLKGVVWAVLRTEYRDGTYSDNDMVTLYTDINKWNTTTTVENELRNTIKKLQDEYTYSRNFNERHGMSMYYIVTGYDAELDKLYAYKVTRTRALQFNPALLKYTSNQNIPADKRGDGDHKFKFIYTEGAASDEFKTEIITAASKAMAKQMFLKTHANATRNPINVMKITEI